MFQMTSQSITNDAVIYTYESKGLVPPELCAKLAIRFGCDEVQCFNHKQTLISALVCKENFVSASTGLSHVISFALLTMVSQGLSAAYEVARYLGIIMRSKD